TKSKASTFFRPICASLSREPFMSAENSVASVYSWTEARGNATGDLLSYVVVRAGRITQDAWAQRSTNPTGWRFCWYREEHERWWLGGRARLDHPAQDRSRRLLLQGHRPPAGDPRPRHRGVPRARRRRHLPAPHRRVHRGLARRPAALLLLPRGAAGGGVRARRAPARPRRGAGRRALGGRDGERGAVEPRGAGPGPALLDPGGDRARGRGGARQGVLHRPLRPGAREPRAEA